MILITKETLSAVVVNMGSVISECRTALRSASVKFEEQNHDWHDLLES